MGTVSVLLVEERGQGVYAYIAEALECALGAVGAGLGVEGEGAEAAEVLEVGEVFGVEVV